MSDAAVVRRMAVGLGANLGDAQATLEAAMEALRTTDGLRWVAQSAWYRSAPVEATGPDFFNAVVLLDSAWSPAAVLDRLQAIEAQHGRERPYRNAPRTLDLDLLVAGEVVQDDPHLTLPHPRWIERAFVLLPLLEVWPASALVAAPALQAMLAARGVSTVTALQDHAARLAIDQGIERLPTAI